MDKINGTFLRLRSTFYESSDRIMLCVRLFTTRATTVQCTQDRQTTGLSINIRVFAWGQVY